MTLNPEYFPLNPNEPSIPVIPTFTDEIITNPNDNKFFTIIHNDEIYRVYIKILNRGQYNEDMHDRIILHKDKKYMLYMDKMDINETDKKEILTKLDWISKIKMPFILQHATRNAHTRFVNNTSNKISRKSHSLFLNTLRKTNTPSETNKQLETNRLKNIQIQLDPLQKELNELQVAKNNTEQIIKRQTALLGKQSHLPSPQRENQEKLLREDIEKFNIELRGYTQKIIEIEQNIKKTRQKNITDLAAQITEIDNTIKPMRDVVLSKTLNKNTKNSTQGKLRQLYTTKSKLTSQMAKLIAIEEKTQLGKGGRRKKQTKKINRSKQRKPKTRKQHKQHKQQ